MERLEFDEIIDFYEKKVKNLEANIDKRYLEITKMSKEVRKYWRRRQVAQYLKELKKFKRLEEQDRLIKLPCKVGDTVYVIVGKNISAQKIQRATVDSEMKIEFCTKRRGFALFDIGKTVFLTKSEAEAKLKEMRGSNND